MNLFVTLNEQGLDAICENTPKRLVLSIKKIIDDSDPIISVSADNKFPIAPNEGNRLQAVHRSKLADSSSEEQFDRLVWLAAWGLESSIALMTILTSEYQWFKASYGMEMEKTPRSWAFCNYTINQKGIFEVQDLREHPVFSTNPAVLGAPYFRFYAGAPIYDPDGFALGSICIMDFQPRQLDAQQKKALLELAAIASEEVKLQEVLSRS
ncbi:GAF domain-containing protein [Acinetobacter lactucae]|uniref:GAF domain-containing protein n=1 Tax=Acinetobacter lactucae TaxID=1785128 RepID=UPI00358DB98D